MLARAKRLQTADFGKNATKKIIIGHFLVRFGKNKTDKNRFAAVVGSKFAKTAVERHRWQRQIREKLQKWPELGLDVIVSPLAEAKKTGPQKASEELLEGFKRLN